MGWLDSVFGGKKSGGKKQSGGIRKGKGGKTFEDATKGRVIIRQEGKKPGIGNPPQASKKK